MGQSDTKIRPEIHLLLCCFPGEGGQFARVEQILRAPLNWLLLFQLANENGMLPLLCERLPQALNAIPAETKAQFSEANRRNMFRGLLLSAELLRITESLRQKGIVALCYKGPVLGQLAYGDPLLRQFGDLDIVVPQKSMAAVYGEMEALGYKAKFAHSRFLAANGKDIPGEYVFVHRTNGAMIEWHTPQTLRHFPNSPDVDAMISRSVMVPMNGRKVATFSPADTVLMLCVHGAKDFWSRLIWVADVAALAGKLNDADWSTLFTEAKKYDAERMVMLGLWMAHAVFNCRLPASILQEIESGDVVVKVGDELVDYLLHTREPSAGLAWRSIYRIRMVPSIWKGVRYWLRLSTAPAEEDWSVNQHAPGARARYALLRPMRLWRKYGGPAGKEHRDKRN